MRTKLLPLVSAACLSAGISAQYLGEPPTEVVPYGASKLTTAVVGNNVNTINYLHLSDHLQLPADTYYALLTVTRSSGGAGGYDILSGLWNPVTGVFTKNADVDALMTAGTEYSGSVSHDLQVFVWEEAAGGARLATRTGISGPFTNMKLISGSGFPPGAVDVHIGQIDGKDVVFFIDGSSVAVMDLDRNTGAATNKRTAITNPPTGVQTHSPAPMNDFLGTSRALFFSLQVAAGRSDGWFTSAVDDSAVKFPVKVVSAWINNPGVVGGSVTWADSGTSYLSCQDVGYFGVSSGSVNAQTGGTLNMTLFAPAQKKGSPAYIGAVWVGVLANSGTSVPGVGGKISIDLTLPIITLPSVAILPEQGIGAYNLTIPANSPQIKLATMPIMLDAVAGKLYLGNSGQVELK
jgi:hypothetical protein